MPRLRCIPAIMLVLAIAFGGGYAPMPSDARAMAGSADMAAPAEQPMPDCPMCAPDDAVSPMCASSCAALAAILPAPALAPIGSATLGEPLFSPRRLADAAVGPEPPPPKSAILA